MQIRKKYQFETSILINSYYFFMLAKHILQLYNIHVLNKMIERSYKDSLDRIFVIKLCENKK